MKFKAYIKYKYDEKVRLDLVDKEVTSSDLVIKTTHVGISRGDVYIMENAWKGTEYPAVGTAESVGIVDAVGDNTRGFKVGDRVGVGYILKTCMKCDYCNSGLYQYCDAQKNTELGGWGGMGEKIIVDYRLAVKIPPTLKSEIATPLTCYGITAFSSIKKANLMPSSRVGVIGLGGMGQILVKLLVAFGHEVTVFSHSPEKEAIATEFGVKNFILTSRADWSSGFTKYFDLIVNASPMDFDLNEYIVLLKAMGSFCYIGLPFNKQSFQTTKLADYGSRSIYGSYVGNTQEMLEMFDFVSQHNIEPDIITMPISDFEKAIKIIKAGIPYKRIVLTWYS